MKVRLCELAMAIRTDDAVEFRTVRLGKGAQLVASRLPASRASGVPEGVEVEVPKEGDAPVPDELCEAIVLLWGVIVGLERAREPK